MCGGSQGISKVIRQLLQPVVEGLDVVLSSLRLAEPGLDLTIRLTCCLNSGKPAAEPNRELLQGSSLSPD